MLFLSLPGRRNRKSHTRINPQVAVAWESLENRQLLSASMVNGPGHGPPGGGPGGGMNPPPPPPGGGATIQFSQSPSAVHLGLTTLAATDGVAAPSASSVIHLANNDGDEIYTYDVITNGTDTKVSVDLAGDPISPPVHTATTFGAISNTAVTNEIRAIASAMNLTAPSATTAVDVLTNYEGSSVYNVSLVPAGSTTSTTTNATNPPPKGPIISVDSSGNPVGHQRVPLSVLSSAVQTGLTANPPAGATALTSTSLIDVNTLDGVTLYTARYSGTGTQTCITVNTAGTLTSLPTVQQVTFADASPAAQLELQSLATAAGYTSTIASTQAVTQFTEANGTIIYAIHLSTSAAAKLDLAVDSLGNATVPPQDAPPPSQGGSGPNGGPTNGSSGGSGIGTGPGNSTGTGTGAGNNCPPPGTSSGSSTSTSSGSSNSSLNSNTAVNSSTPSIVTVSSSPPSSSSTPSDASPSVTNSSSTASTTTDPVMTVTSPAPTALTKAEIRAAARAAAKAARLALRQARRAAALAAREARIAARLAAQAAKKENQAV